MSSLVVDQRGPMKTFKYPRVLPTLSVAFHKLMIMSYWWRCLHNDHWEAGAYLDALPLINSVHGITTYFSKYQKRNLNISTATIPLICNGNLPGTFIGTMIAQKLCEQSSFSGLI